MKQFRFQLIAGMRLCLALIGLLWFGAITMRAGDRYVVEPGTPGGTNAGEFTDWPIAATQIVWAVNKATSAGDTVWISNGTYVLTNTITVSMNISIFGTGGKPVVDGNNATGCFYLSAMAGAGAVLSNLFITRGTNSSDGGGVYMKYGKVIDCILSNNECGGQVAESGLGGGMCIENNSTVQRCTFVNNRSNSGKKYGGGLAIAGKGNLIDHCSFLTNTSSLYGGGLAGYSSAGNNTITGCDFICNVAATGGGIYFYGYQGYSNIVTHCTFVSNTTTTSSGGGVKYERAGQARTSANLITNCWFSNNIARGGGGAISMLDLRVKNCTIAGNISTATVSIGGGGIHMDNNADNLVENCIIEKNQAAMYGGGIDYAGGTIRNCLIRDNFASGGASPYGGGMYIQGTGTISSCTIVSNYSSRGGGICEELAVIPNFENCIIYFNKCLTASYSNYYRNASAAASFTNCCLAPELTGVSTNYSTNNITADPQCIDPVSGNYRLIRGSRCVNTGVSRSWMTGVLDLDGRYRIDRYSGIVDIGCYEHVPSGSMFSFR